jgi:hypothetical protein
VATERQIAANRLNAQKSSGPKTVEGRARSAKNAITHGLSARQIYCLRGEDLSHWNRLFRDLWAYHAPVGSHEKFLVRSLFRRRVSIERAERAEDSMLCAASYEEEHAKDPHSWKRQRLEALVRASMPGLATPPTQVAATTFATQGEEPTAETDYRDSAEEEEEEGEEFLEVAIKPTETELKDAEALVRTFRRSLPTIEALRRYHATERNAFYKDLHELERAQARRRGQATVPPIALDVSSDRTRSL